MLVAVLLWGGVIACDAKSVSVFDLSLGLQRGDDPGQTTDTRDTGQRAASPVRRERALASGRATTQHNHLRPNSALSRGVCSHCSGGP